jgi:hypothetical protein
MGASYYNSKTITDAMADSNGLSSTQFARWEPDRSGQIEGAVKGINLESILLTTLDPAREEDDQSTIAFKHSGYGEGGRIEPHKQVSFQRRKMTGNKKTRADLTPIEGVYRIDVRVSFV